MSYEASFISYIHKNKKAIEKIAEKQAIDFVKLLKDNETPKPEEIEWAKELVLGTYRKIAAEEDINFALELLENQ